MTARDFYGPAWRAGKEGAPYHWSVELLQDPATGKLEGTSVLRLPGRRAGGLPGERDGWRRERIYTAGNKVSGGGRHLRHCAGTGDLHLRYQHRRA